MTQTFSWLSRRSCIDVSPNIFYRTSTAAALKICRGCPVKEQCLAEALAQEIHPTEVFGVRAGLTAKARRRLVRGRHHRPVAVCGTDSGYAKHKRDHSTPCDPCRAAHAESARSTERRNPPATS